MMRDLGIAPIAPIVWFIYAHAHNGVIPEIGAIGAAAVQSGAETRVTP